MPNWQYPDPETLSPEEADRRADPDHSNRRYALRDLHTRTPAPIVPRLIIGITGHRPDKLGGYKWDNPLRNWCRERIRTETLALLQIGRCRPDNYTDADYVASRLADVQWQRQIDMSESIAVSGVALGADQDACGVWARMGLPYIAAVPFPGQELAWPPQSRDVYAAVLKHAAGIVYVSPTAPTNCTEAAAMLRKRNRWMAETIDELIAVFDGSPGGTSHMVRSWNWLHSGMRTPKRIDPRDFSG